MREGERNKITTNNNNNKNNNSLLQLKNSKLQTFARNRPNRLTQCCTQFKSPGTKILCVLYLHDNVAFIFK